MQIYTVKTAKIEKKIIKKPCFLTVFENCSILAQSQRTKPPNSIETIFAITFARYYEKKIILGSLDAWLMSDPAYYIEDSTILLLIHLIFL